jgi:hypothetical protein
VCKRNKERYYGSLEGVVLGKRKEPGEKDAFQRENEIE